MSIESFGRDLRYGIRGLVRARIFTFTTVATLTVALALVTVVFAIFNAYVLRPYAVRDPYSLHEIRWRSQDAAGRTFRWSEYEELREREDLFTSVMVERNRTVWADGQRLVAAFVSGNYFDSLGARLTLGRGLADFDARAPGGQPVAVISHEAWSRLFNRDPAAVGREIDANGQRLTIVGITHEQFTGPNDTPPDLWVPATMHALVMHQDLFGPSQPRELAVLARLRSDVSAEQAESALAPFMTRVAARPGPARAEVLQHATPAPLSLELLAVLSPVFAAFALVLVAACANVSNVMLARANGRHREIGIRLSLGASRGRVVRQLLTEGLLIATLAGLAALGGAAQVLRGGLRLFFLSLPPIAAAMTRVIPLDLDHRVFIFTFALAATATIIFALVPALHSTKLTLTDALRGTLGPGLGGARLRNVFVISQVTVSFVLLIAAGTLVRNAIAIRNIDLGMETGGVFSVRQRSQGEPLVSKAAIALAGEGAAARVAVTSANPLTGEMRKAMVRSADADTFVVASYQFASPEYFGLLQIPIVHGRGFQPDEARAEAPVAIVSASAAAALWPGGDPLGRTVKIVMPPEETRTDLTMRKNLYSQADVEQHTVEVTIVGVARDAASGIVYEGRDTAHVYMPTDVGRSNAKALLVRGRSLQDVRAEDLQRSLRRVHEIPLAFEILSLDEALALQMYPLNVASLIALVLSGIGLTLSVSGLYGVMTYGLSQRMREIGIRMALGATSTAVVRLVMTQAARLVAAGAAIGMTLALAALGTLRAFVRLQHVSVLDAGAFAGTVILIAAATAVASYYPARRATRIAPSEALRAD